MPATSVRRRFNQIVNESGDFQIADLCRLSHFYNASVEAMTLRLEGLWRNQRGQAYLICSSATGRTL